MGHPLTFKASWTLSYLTIHLLTSSLTFDLLIQSMQPVETLTTAQRQVYLQDLNPCSTYWVVITAVNCGLRISSSPQLFGLFSPSEFSIALCPGHGFLCSEWIGVNVTSKVADIESALSSVLTSQCLLSDSTCFTNSGFTCYGDDGMVIFRYVDHVDVQTAYLFYCIVATIKISVIRISVISTTSI